MFSIIGLNSINGIVERFRQIREQTQGLTPFEKLNDLGNMTLDFLFEHGALAKISVLADLNTRQGRRVFRTQLLHELLEV